MKSKEILIISKYSTYPVRFVRLLPQCRSHNLHFHQLRIRNHTSCVISYTWHVSLRSKNVWNNKELLPSVNTTRANFSILAHVFSLINLEDKLITIKQPLDNVWYSNKWSEDCASESSQNISLKIPDRTKRNHFMTSSLVQTLHRNTHEMLMMIIIADENVWLWWRYIDGEL